MLDKSTKKTKIYNIGGITLMENNEQISKLQEQLEQVKESETVEIVESEPNFKVATIAEPQNSVDGSTIKPDKFELQTRENKFVTTMATDNSVAIQMAQDEYESLKNQKGIAKKIGEVVKENTKADIESANIKVEEKKKNNKVKRQEIKNELFKLKKEKKYIREESRHKLAMQKFEHRKQKYADLLLRHCRKRAKNAEGKWEYLKDKNGDWLVNMPSGFSLFWLIVFDSIVQFLNQTSEVISGTNKVVFKGVFIIFIVLLLFVPPFRNWLLGLVGINFG